ncbi:MAG TPA: M48 family metallopeptidase [Bacteroidia bacterium]
MTFEATLLSTFYAGGRTSGHLSIMDDKLCFIDTEEKVTGLPLKSINIRLGGAGNRYVYFTHDDYPDICIYTDDKQILRTPEFSNNEYLKKHGAKIRKNRLGLKIFSSIIILLIVGTVTSALIFRGKIVNRIAGLISPETEQKIADELKKSAIAGKSIVTDSTLMFQLDSITSPLIKSLNDKRFKFNFTIVEDKTLNAFALPGGSVVINSGLIEKTKSAEELAGVLAHEISHVTCRHHIRSIIGNMGIWILIRSAIGDVSGVSADIASIGASLGSLKYSRDFETEADDSGFHLLVKSGIHPKGMIDFFGTMKKESGVAASAMDNLDFLSTHPGTDDRIKALKKKKVEAKTYHPIKVNYSAFQKHIKQYFDSATAKSTNAF